MNRAEYIQELEDSMLEAIEKQDPKAVKRFVRSLTAHSLRDRDDILHSIELLAQQMSSMQKNMDTRFESVDKRIGMLMWFIGIGFTVITVFMGLIQFINK